MKRDQRHYWRGGNAALDQIRTQVCEIPDHIPLVPGHEAVLDVVRWMIHEPCNHCYDEVDMEIKDGWRQRRKKSLVSFSRWLIPGLGIKRWLVLILMGTTLIGVGLGVLILEIYRTAPKPGGCPCSRPPRCASWHKETITILVC